MVWLIGHVHSTAHFVRKYLNSQNQIPTETTLRRAITLPLLVFYSLGVTIGAGIYVLIGETAAQAGVYAPMSFLLAAGVMLFSAGSFSELSGCFPQSAGKVAYVEAAYGFAPFTVITGGSFVVSGHCIRIYHRCRMCGGFVAQIP